MKHLIALTLIVALTVSCKEQPPLSQTTSPIPKIETHTIELSYLKGATVSDILNMIKKQGLILHEQNPALRKTVTGNLEIIENFFSDFYRKTEGDYECDIDITGLNDDLGSISITVRNIKQNRNQTVMKEIFNTLINELPPTLFPSSIEGNISEKSLSKNINTSSVPGLYRQVIDEVQYTFIMLDSEISLDIARDGN